MPKITKTTVDNIKPGLLEQWVWDSELQGFGVRCMPTGLKTFVLRYRTMAGKQRKSVIARCGVVTVDKARDMARKTLAQVAEGADPQAERRPAKADSTKSVEAMFKAYIAHMRSKGRISAGEVERVLLLAKNNVADALGRCDPAATVTPMQIVDHVAEIFRAGSRGAADKHRSYIASAFQFAIESANDYTVVERQDWGVKQNPATSVPRDMDAVQARDRNLSAEELKALWQGTRQNSDGFALETAACVRILIACGQRVQETLRIEGCEVDLKAGVWRMPAHKTKGRKLPHTIPLPAAIIPDLQLLIDINGDGLLMPGRNGLEMEHQSVMRALARWSDDRGLAPFQTRDLRRTWKSRAHDAGIDRFTRDLIQQHAKSDTGSKNYDRAEYLPQMRDAMAKWSSWIDANLEDQEDQKLAA